MADNQTPEVPAQKRVELPPDPMSFLSRKPTPPAPPVEPPKAETPPPAPPAPPAQSDELRTAFSRVAAMERETRDLKAQLEQSRRQAEELEPLRELAGVRDKARALDILAKQGITFKDLSDQYVQRGAVPPEHLIRDQLDQFRQVLDSRLSTIEQRETQRSEAEMRRDVLEYVNTSEAFPLTKLVKAQELVHGSIRQHYNDTRELLSYEQAAAAVESGIESLLKAALADEKTRARFLGASPQPPPAEVRETPRESPVLSNRTAAPASQVLEDGFDPNTASDDELIKRLAKKLRFQQ